MITTKLLIITTVTTLATLLGSFSVNVYAKDFVDEPNVPDESVPIGGSGGTEQRDTNHEGETVDFNNGDKGCDNNHNNCQHVNHNSGSSSSLTSMTDKLTKSLPQGCVINNGPTIDLSRLVFEVSCPR